MGLWKDRRKRGAHWAEVGDGWMRLLHRHRNGGGDRKS